MLEDRQVRQTRTKATCPAGRPQKATKAGADADTPKIHGWFPCGIFYRSPT